MAFHLFLLLTHSISRDSIFPIFSPFNRPRLMSTKILRIDEILEIGTTNNNGCPAKNPTNMFIMEFTWPDSEDGKIGGFEIYLCYLSHFDPNYNGFPATKAPFKVANKNNSATQICTSDYSSVVDSFPFDKENLNAWHGIGLIFKKSRQIDVITSFSDETFTINLKDIAAFENKFYIAFGNPNSFWADILVEKNADKMKNIKEHLNGMRNPPKDVFFSVHKMQKAFGNAGFCIIPLDMAYKMSNGKKSRVMHLVMIYSDDKGKGLEKINVSFGVSNSRENPIEFCKFRESNIIAIANVSQICTHNFVAVEAAMIKDRFRELLISGCPIDKCPLGKSCPREICPWYKDYAIRLGCLECDKNTDNEIFLMALEDWINKQKHIDEKELAEWSGTNFNEFLQDPKNEQTIEKLANGEFKYISIPDMWANEGAYILLHDCAAFGKFASAVKKGKRPEAEEKAALDKYGKLTNWKEDFKFVERCGFSKVRYINETHTIGDLYQAQVRKEFEIGIGALKKYKDGNFHGYNLTKAEMQAHMFKYGFYASNSPARQSRFPDTNETYRHERVIFWGRFFVPPEMIYNEFKTYKMEIFFRPIEFYDFPGNILESDLKFAKVEAIFDQMIFKCVNLTIFSSRMIAVQKITFRNRKTNANETVRVTLQTSSYKLNGEYYVPQYDDDRFDRLDVYQERMIWDD